MNNYSPGPWTWSRDESGTETTISITDAMCEPVIWGECINTEPDARLLAAAPDLLTACEALIVECDLLARLWTDGDVLALDQGYGLAIDAGRDAIARARGKQP